MRIRHVRPSFFSDHFTGTMPADQALTYIGLWCAADDAGWLAWDVQQLGVEVWPWRPVRAREALVKRTGQMLEDAGKLTKYPCGCALLTRFGEHQRPGGRVSTIARDEHLKHVGEDEDGKSRTDTGNPCSKGREGTGRDSKGEGGSLRELLRETTDPETGRIVWVGPETTA